MAIVVTPDLYLASQSPRRRELLQQIGVRHTSISVQVPEVPQANELPTDYVQRLARTKASAGALAMLELGLPPRPVMGADTLVVCDQHLLEKPKNAQAAAAMLRQLSGRRHQVMTAIAICLADRIEQVTAVTEVDFRTLSDTEIAAYWRTGEPQDKAGGYAIQGLGAAFVTAIHGSYSNVVGLPIESCLPLLQLFDVPWWQVCES